MRMNVTDKQARARGKEPTMQLKCACGQVVAEIPGDVDVGHGELVEVTCPNCKRVTHYRQARR